MYKVIKDNKIVAVLETDIVVGLNYDTIEQDTEHNIDDYEQYNGEYLLKSEIPAPTHEEQSKKREAAYIAETDPIQTHIDRLKDGEQTPEIVAEIEALRIERDEKIAAIKERYPYPTDPII